MPTKTLKLSKAVDGYYRTQWIDDRGQKHRRSFGKDRMIAQNLFRDFHYKWKQDRTIRNPGDPLSIREGWDRFKGHHESYYVRKDGKPTGELTNIEHALNPLLDMFGEMMCSEFNVNGLKTVRDRMHEDDLCLNVINRRINKIRHVFKWLVSEGLIRAEIWWGLKSLESLKSGRGQARETSPVGPVPEVYINQVIQKAPLTIAAMVELQWLTGMRPGELCIIRPIDIDMGKSTWLYRPSRHKTEHYNRARIVPIGPRGQQIIRPFLKRSAADYMFSPKESLRQRFDTKPNHRKKQSIAPTTQRRVGDHYTTQSYARAIEYICKEHNIPRWSPNQLRHNAATKLTSMYGSDVARVVLGQCSLDATQIYIEADLEKAVKAMEKVG